MSARAKRNIHWLHALRQLKDKERTQLIRRILNDDAIRCLCECVHNVMKHNIPLSPAQEKKLDKQKRSMYKLTNKKIPLTMKRKILVQRGGAGILSVILPAAIAVISAILATE